MTRKVFTTILLVAVFAFGVFAVSASDDLILVNTDEFGLVPILADGRLNGLDLAAPVAVYTTYENTFDANGTPLRVVDGLELLRIDPVTSNGMPLFELDTFDVQPLLSGAVDSLEVDGYTLNYSRDTDWFWVAAPPAADGKVYTFQWENPGFEILSGASVNRSQLSSSTTSTSATAEPAASATPDMTATDTP